jgi:restriction system protein
VAFQLPRNSLFAILLRSPWWLSLLIAFGMFAGVRLFFAPGIAAFFALPFLAIGLYAAVQQLRQPSEGRIAETLTKAKELSWDDFRMALEEAYKREGYAVTRIEGVADLRLAQGGVVTLVACKRWKAMRAGIESLREFDAASKERGAHARVYVAVGEITDNARAFAEERRIRLVQEQELAKLLGGRL